MHSSAVYDDIFNLIIYFSLIISYSCSDDSINSSEAAVDAKNLL